MSSRDTIAAIATPPGKGGVGIVRVSGPDVASIAQSILKRLPNPREATYLPFYDQAGEVLDQGIALYFPNPQSFTGEDVLELQGHGGPVVMDLLLQATLTAGARVANPGEFSERAFLNDKLDLAQAEAIADLIDASSSQAARSAVRSLQGEFSERIQILLDALTELRIFVEASIDFPDEDIDFIEESTVAKDLAMVLANMEDVTKTARQGALLQEGMTAVIAGKPNAGKSSLLNNLSGREAAIVTDIAGTTRDVLREYIHIEGMPIHIIDTAGLRETDDIVEQHGVQRAWDEIENADILLLMVDAAEVSAKVAQSIPVDIKAKIPEDLPVVTIRNKVDLLGEAPSKIENDEDVVISLSAKNGDGVSLLTEYLKHFMGFERLPEGTFIARRRHLSALARAQYFLQQGLTQLTENKAGELLADDLRQSQEALAEITGEFTADDLLGKIFGSFCIGK